MRHAALLAAACLAVVATSASAAVPIDLGPESSTQAPHLATDAAGTGYLTWVDTPSGDDVLHFCSLPTGGTACAQSHTFTYNPPGPNFGGDAGNSPVLTPDGRLLVLDSRCCGANSNKKFLYTSTNGGATFTPAAPTTPPTGEIGQHVSGMSGTTLFAAAGVLAATERLLTVDTFPVTAGGDFQATGTAGLTTTRFGLNPNPGADMSTYTESLALQGSTLVAVYTQLSTQVVNWRKYNGGGADLNVAGSWSAPQAIGTANVDSNAQVVGGPGGIYVAYNTGSPGSGHVVLQKFTGSAWGAPVTVSDVGAGENFALSEDSAGVLHFAWRDSAAALRYRYGRDANNTDFTRAQTLVTSGNFFDPHVAIDAAGNGWLTYHDGSPNHAFAIPVAPGEPPIVPPTPPPPAPIPPFMGPTHTVTTSAGNGISITLSLPNSCLRSSQAFTTSVGTKIKHKVAHGRHLAVTKVIFSLDGLKRSTVTKKPFRFTGSVTGAPRSVHVVSAKVTVRIRRAHHKDQKVTKTVKGKVTIC